MKRISRIFFLLFTALCVAMLGSTVVMAEDMSVSVVYQQNNNCWKISGTAGSLSHKPVTLKIYKSENTSLTKEALLKNEGIVKLVYTKEGGAFSDSIDFATFFSSGSYTVEALCAGFTKASTSFMYVNPDEAASLMEKINDAKDISEIAELIQNNCYQLGIDEAEYVQKADCINEIIFYRKPEGGYSAQSFLKEYNNALCVYDLTSSEETLEALLKKHGEAVSYDYETDIKVHGEDVESMLRARLKNEDYKLLSIDRAFEENLLVARILCTSRYTYIEGIIAGEISGGIYDLDDYNKVQNKENVFKNLYNNRSGIEKYSDIKTVFEKAAEAALEEEKTPAAGGGGGGGGGGGAPSKPKDISIKEVEADPGEDVLTKLQFTDTKNHWAATYISFMADNKIINGYPDGTFKPEGFVTRAEFVKLVTVAFKLSEKEAKISFEDVSKDDWFKSYVMIASSNGVVNGFDGKFRPNDSISRQDAAVMLGRLTEASEKATDSTFNDETEISAYALSSVKKLAAMGIIKGVDNSFMPLRNITRAEAAAMIVRLLGE